MGGGEDSYGTLVRKCVLQKGTFMLLNYGTHQQDLLVKIKVGVKLFFSLKLRYYSCKVQSPSDIDLLNQLVANIIVFIRLESHYNGNFIQ